MKSNCVKLILLAFATALILIIALGTPQYYNESESANKQMVVISNYIEIVKTPTGERETGRLTLNDVVILTGNCCKYRLRNDEEATWLEVRFDDNEIGWVKASDLGENGEK